MKFLFFVVFGLLAVVAHAQAGEFIVRWNENGLRGVVDEQGNVVIPYEYQSIEHYQDKKRFLVSKKAGENAWRMGVLDEAGKVVIPMVYEQLTRVSNNGDEDTHMAKRDGQWGYVNIITGEVLIEPKYAGLYVDSLSTDTEGMGIALANNGEKWGVIDTHGKTLVPFEFDEIVNSSVDQMQLRRKNALVTLRFEGQRYLGESVDCQECGRFSTDSARRFAAQQPPASFGGIGVAINHVAPDERTVRLVDVMADGPAARAGLQIQDEIVNVDGKPVGGMTLEQVREALRGEAGSTVNVTVRRLGETKDFVVERQVIRL
jgi:hypothetical protein